MPDRYFVSQPIVGDRVTLEGSEAHHLAHVMRAKAGTEVILFDGSGAELAANVESVARGSVVLRIVSRVEVDREAACRLVLGVALPKGDRQRWLVEKGVELGVTELVPLVTARGVAEPGPNVVDRLRRAVIEATKQCGRTRLLEIAEPRSWSDFVDRPPAAARRLVAHPLQAGARPTSLERDGATSVVLGVGPEGGLTEAEVALALEHGWETVDLGPRVLRVETAALALASWWLLDPR